MFKVLKNQITILKGDYQMLRIEIWSLSIIIILLEFLNLIKK